MDLSGVDARLRALLDPFRDRLEVTQDGSAGLTLSVPGATGPSAFVAGVRPGKRYVSFYLMPLYACPDLLVGLSPALRRRMQGKSCFNFASIEEGLLAELAALTAAGIERYVPTGRSSTG